MVKLEQRVEAAAKRTESDALAWLKANCWQAALLVAVAAAIGHFL